MTRNQFLLSLWALVALCTIAFMIAFVAIKRYESEAQINAQTEIERVKIEQEAAIIQTKARMQWVPWYTDSQ